MRFSLSEMSILVLQIRNTLFNVLSTKQISRRISQPSASIKPASVKLFFVNGNADSIKIVANPEGIHALKCELEEAERSIRRNKSYFFGDPLWLKGASRLVAIEPSHLAAAPMEIEENESVAENTELAPRIFMFSLVMIAATLMTVGVVTVCQWLF
jgi:hypothetical protein